MIDLSTLSPNWRELRLHYIEQLESLIARGNSQAVQARELLEAARKEVAEIQNALAKAKGQL